MKNYLLQLCELLMQPTVTGKEAADQLGQITAHQNHELVVTPNNATEHFFSEASIVSRPEGTSLAYIKLTLLKGVTLGELTEAFGPYHQLPRLASRRVSRVQFQYRRPTLPYMVTLVVSHQDNQVTEIILRRDRELKRQT
jgi:hypothetical protein